MLSKIDVPSRWARHPVASKAYELFDDFDAETTIDGTGTNASAWVGAAIASGTGVMTVDEAGGVVRFANSGSTDDSGYQIQRDMETIVLQASKEVRFQCRFRQSDATESSFFAGIAITDTTIQHATTDTLAGGLTISDGIGFFKPDGEATIYGVVIRDSVQLSTGAIATLANDTYAELTFTVEMTATAGEGIVKFYVNGVDNNYAIRSLTLPISTEEVHSLSLAWKAGAAAAKTCDVDYIGVLVER